MKHSSAHSKKGGNIFDDNNKVNRTIPSSPHSPWYYNHKNKPLISLNPVSFHLPKRDISFYLRKEDEEV